MKSLETVVFKDKKFGDILEEIYKNQNKTKRTISTLIQELKPLIIDIGDATLLVPLIKDYLDMGVKNDDQLIKMAGIIQRLVQSSKEHEGNSDFTISEEEKNQLMNEIENIKHGQKGNNLSK
jgi:hypothetical protein